MPAASSSLGRTLDEVVSRRSPRRILPASVKGGRRAAVMVVGKRGRYVRYRIPVGGKVNDIAIMPTIRSAIMHSVRGKIDIKKTDIREKVRRRKVSILLAVVVDGSSSMLEGSRPGMVHSILDDLFLDAYQKRDRMALVHCGGGQATLLLSFAGNVEAGRQAVERAPWGGTDALPAGLELAGEVISQRLRTERNAIPAIVLISDGDLTGQSAERVTGQLEELSEKAAVLCIDLGTDSGEPLMSELADTVEGGYFPSEKTLPPAAVPDLGELDNILLAASITMVNPRCGPALLSGFGEKEMKAASELLRDRAWDIDVAEGCGTGCIPRADAHHCHACRVRMRTGALEKRSARVPVEYIAGKLGPGELEGTLYARRHVTGGHLAALRRGLLMLSPGGLDAGLLRRLSEIVNSGEATPAGAHAGFRAPAGRRLAILLGPDTKSDYAPLVRLRVRNPNDPSKLPATLMLMKQA